MDYEILVNKDNALDRNYVPSGLVDVKSKYKDGIMINKLVYEQFLLMKSDALKLGYNIDIMSGYRDYFYQDRLFNQLVEEKGLEYTLESIAKPGYSEHQTGLAIDICVFRNGKFFIENEIKDFEEIRWVINNCHNYGFVLRYPENNENITGYKYEPWHFRYVGDSASYLYMNNILFDNYKKNK
jgi:D-alanyl-D-alanine carboxypeptidase